MAHGRDGRRTAKYPRAVLNCRALEDRVTPAAMLPDLFVRADYLTGWYINDASGGGKQIRFSTAMANGGVGAFEMRGTSTYVTNPDGTQKQAVNQRIYNSDSTYTDVPSGYFTYHPTHGHIHFDDMAQSRIRLRPADNSVGAVLVESEKTSFCLIDIDHYDDTLPGSPPDNVYSTCNPVYQGISVGWNDVYDSSLDGQSIPLNGVPPGNYWLEVECDPLDVVQETNNGNNVTRIAITISDTQVPPAEFRILTGTPVGANYAPVDHVDYSFNFPVDASTMTPDKFSFTGPAGVIPITGVKMLSDTQFRVEFAQQGVVGTYTMTVSPTIKSATGDYLDQNNNGTGNESADQYFNIFTVVAPRIFQTTPSGQTSAPISTVQISYNKTMDSSSFTTADIISFTGPGGVDLLPQITGIVPATSGGTSAVFDVNFTSQSAMGIYSMVVSSDVRDAQQNLVDQNTDGTPGTLADRYTITFTAGVVGPDAFGYAAQSESFQSLDIAGQSGTFTILNTGDDVTAAVDLGSRTFTFYGTTYTGTGKLFVSSNGLITFDSATNAWQNGNLSGLAQASIAVLWDDWINSSGNPQVVGKYFDDNSDTIDDRLVIQWNRQVHVNGSTNQVTFQAVLQLNTGATQGKIVANYSDIDTGDGNANGQSASIGIKPAGSGAAGVSVSTNSTHYLVGGGKAIQFDVPKVLSITRVDANPVDAGEIVDYLVTFNQPIDPVNFSQPDFTLTPTGTLTGYNVEEVHPTGSPFQYEVHVKTGVGNGTLRLNFVDDDSVRSALSAKIGGTGLGNGAFSAGEAYTVIQPPPEVNRLALDDDTGQASMVRFVTVYFDRVVDFVGTYAAAFAVTGPGGAPVAFTADASPSTPNFTAVKLTFTGGNLADGQYSLTVFGNQVSTGGVFLDGDGSGAGSNHVEAFHCLFGDSNGDGYTDNVDLLAFRLTNGSDSTSGNFTPSLDSNGDGNIDNVDLIAFRQRIGVTP